MERIPLQKALLEIKESTGPFKIQFSKVDGTLREMVCIKANKNKSEDRQNPHEKSHFNYSLQEKYMLLLMEVVVPTHKRCEPGLGTIHALPQDLRVDSLRVGGMQKKHKSVFIASLRQFNDKLIYTIE